MIQSQLKDEWKLRESQHHSRRIGIKSQKHQKEKNQLQDQFFSFLNSITRHQWILAETQCYKLESKTKQN